MILTIKGTVSRDGQKTGNKADMDHRGQKKARGKDRREHRRAEERSSKGPDRIEDGEISKGPGGLRGYPEGEEVVFVPNSDTFEADRST